MLATAGPAGAGQRACGASAYSYAGLQGTRKSHGVSATLTPLAAPNVTAGHVAAWVGVGWAGGGPNGQDEWIQVGMTAETGYATAKLYYEIVTPGAPYRYAEFADAAAGRRHRVTVLELAHRPNWWRVWVDGKAATAPVFLPKSDGAWEPVATAESWNGNTRACNSLAYRFENVEWSSKAGGWWHPLGHAFKFSDPGYRVVRPAAQTFFALSRLL